METGETGQTAETGELHLELFLGKRVVDADGKSVGRIEEMRAECSAGPSVGLNVGEHECEWVVVEYLVGPAAILERFSAWRLMGAAMRLLGVYRFTGGYKVPWHQLDLSDPDKPRLRCPVDKLPEFSAKESGPE